MTGAELLERHALLQSPSRIEELVRIFIHATKVRKAVLDCLVAEQGADALGQMEIGFWEMFPYS